MAVVPVAVMSGVVYPLQAAATTGNGNVIAVPSSFRHHNFIVSGTGTISAGAVSLETSNDPNYTGTWVLLTTAITPVSNSLTLFAYSGLLNFVRARISTGVTGAGGSASVDYEGAKSY